MAKCNAGCVMAIGEGTCMRGGLQADLESSCQSNDTWHFTSCPGKELLFSTPISSVHY